MQKCVIKRFSYAIYFLCDGDRHIFHLACNLAFRLAFHRYLPLGDIFQIPLYHTTPTFNNFEKKPFQNIVGKGENAGKKHCILFPQCFLTLFEKVSIFPLNLLYHCKCFQFGPV